MSDRQRVKKVIISVTKTMKEKRNRTVEKEMRVVQKRRCPAQVIMVVIPGLKKKESATMVSDCWTV